MAKIEKKILNYRIIVEPEKYPNGDTVYNAYCPTLGIADYGDTVDRVLESIKDGIELAIDSMAKDGEEIPVDNIEQQIITSAKVKLPANAKVDFAL